MKKLRHSEGSGIPNAQWMRGGRNWAFSATLRYLIPAHCPVRASWLGALKSNKSGCKPYRIMGKPLHLVKPQFFNYKMKLSFGHLLRGLQGITTGKALRTMPHIH